eukprot:CAMPEP_0184308932 /NCGR_PEP_ID=MMETSP1049-20130417/17243_1 /TAXON_ID=77928 /ORGANISM="Proteomonas sulcata, Strain CCMP704" /LENGTH=101 /DNA_ID=CAMNT_0026621715 /DNA_START=32 /DNA_END=337 /DNA_ORIENTATION=+
MEYSEYRKPTVEGQTGFIHAIHDEENPQANTPPLSSFNPTPFLTPRVPEAYGADERLQDISTMMQDLRPSMPRRLSDPRAAGVMRPPVKRKPQGPRKMMKV